MSHRGGPAGPQLVPVLHGSTSGSPSNGFNPATAAGLMSFAAELQKSSASAAGSGFLGPLPPVLPSPAIPGGAISGFGQPPSSMSTVPGSGFPYPPAHLAAVAAAAAAGHFAFLPLAAAAAGHPAAGMMNLATMAAAAGHHLQNMRAANVIDQQAMMSLTDAAAKR